MRYEYLTPAKKYHNEDDPIPAWLPDEVEDKGTDEEEYDADCDDDSAELNAQWGDRG